MNLPLIACLCFGVLVIVLRGPFIFWPGETASFYKDKLLADAGRIRFVVILPFCIGIAMAFSNSDLRSGFAFLVTVIGLILVAVCGVVLLIPDDIKGLVTTIFDHMSHAILRGLGAFSVVIALVWIIASFVYLGT